MSLSRPTALKSATSPLTHVYSYSPSFWRTLASFHPLSVDCYHSRGRAPHNNLFFWCYFGDVKHAANISRIPHRRNCEFLSLPLQGMALLHMMRICGHPNSARERLHSLWSYTRFCLTGRRNCSFSLFRVSRVS